MYFHFIWKTEGFFFFSLSAGWLWISGLGQVSTILCCFSGHHRWQLDPLCYNAAPLPRPRVLNILIWWHINEWGLQAIIPLIPSEHMAWEDGYPGQHHEYLPVQVSDWERVWERESKVTVMAGHKAVAACTDYLRRVHGVVGWQLLQGNWEAEGSSLKTFI